MTEKEQLQARARELGIDDDQTVDELKDAIAQREADHQSVGDVDMGELLTGGQPVASREDNAALEHSVSGSTTRDDLTDAGVPMLQGQPEEPNGPEDALGVGEKRGDYRQRVDPLAHESRPVVGGGQEVTAWFDRETGAPAEANADGAYETVVDRQPTSALVAQAPRAESIGDVPGVKGGVETDPLASDVGRRAVAAQERAEA